MTRARWGAEGKDVLSWIIFYLMIAYNVSNFGMRKNTFTSLTHTPQVYRESSANTYKYKVNSVL